MAMRSNCRHYESRTYPSGDVVRKCRLDAAPEAPWNCPPECPLFERRTVDVGWQYGSLTGAMAPTAEPAPSTAAAEDVAALLDAAEDIVNAAGAELLAEQSKKRKKGRFGRRKKR